MNYVAKKTGRKAPGWSAAAALAGGLLFREAGVALLIAMRPTYRHALLFRGLWLGGGWMLGRVIVHSELLPPGRSLGAMIPSVLLCSGAPGAIGLALGEWLKHHTMQPPPPEPEPDQPRLDPSWDYHDTT